MAQVIVKMKIMPESPEVNLDDVFENINTEVKNFGGEIGKREIIPVAFGLKSLEVIFVMDESKGSTDELESKLNEIEGVQSVEVTDVRRAMG